MSRLTPTESLRLRRDRIWYRKGTGAAVLHARMHLLQEILAPWQRRGRTLLEINCGSGLLQDLLWESGFDITGCEPDPGLRALFCEQHGSRFTVDAAHADHLPYDNQEFDWALLHLDQTADTETTRAYLEETRRVVSRGLAVLFWNRFSMGGRALSRSGVHIPLASPFTVWHLMTGLGEGRITGRSILAGPPCTWKTAPSTKISHSSAAGTKPSWLSSFINGSWPLPAGTLCILRMDFGPVVPITPRPLRIRKFRLAPTALAGAEGEMPSVREKASIQLKRT